jgi:peptide/nickel transport system substrate-binding protein
VRWLAGRQRGARLAASGAARQIIAWKEEQMKLKEKGCVVLMILALLTPLIAGCQSQPAPAEETTQVEETAAQEATSTPEPQAPPSAGDKTLIVAMDISSATSMDTHAHFELVGAMVNFATCETLVQVTADDLNTAVPVLAKSWEISDDALSYTFHLRDDVTFASGNPMTAKDVYFSWMRMKNKQGMPSWFMGYVDELEVIDDYTIKATLTDAAPSFIKVLTTPYMCVLDSEVVKAHGGTDAEDASTTDTATEWLNQNSAGSGPYILTSWSLKSEVVLEANENWWAGEPLLDKIVIQHVEDPTTALQMVQRGDADMALQLVGPDLIDVARGDPNLNVLTPPSFNIMYLMLTNNPEMSEYLPNKKVRQAIMRAVDYDGIINDVLRGLAVRPPSIIPLGMEGVDPDMAVTRDLDAARALLADAGYPDGFALELTYPVNPLWDQVVAKIQSDLAEIGITVELVPTDYGILMTQIWEERVVPFWFEDWYPDYLDYTIWTDYWSYEGGDECGNAYCNNPELEEVALTIAHEYDHDKRLAAVKKWQEIMIDDAWAITIYQPAEIVVMNKDVKDFGYIPVIFTDWKTISK